MWQNSLNLNKENMHKNVYTKIYGLTTWCIPVIIRMPKKIHTKLIVNNIGNWQHDKWSVHTASFHNWFPDMQTFLEMEKSATGH